jgi:hypothetical protein
VVSATVPHGRNLGFLDPEPLLFHSSSSSIILRLSLINYHTMKMYGQVAIYLQSYLEVSCHVYYPGLFNNKVENKTKIYRNYRRSTVCAAYERDESRY